MRSFCSGLARANTRVPRDALGAARRRRAGRARRRSQPARRSGMPSSAGDRGGRERVVAGDHHRRMPAVRQRRRRRPPRGGAGRPWPTSPSSRRLRLGGPRSSVGHRGQVPSARARTGSRLRPPAGRHLRARARGRLAVLEQRRTSASRAPLTATQTRRRASLVQVVMRRRSASKATSATRGIVLAARPGRRRAWRRGEQRALGRVAGQAQHCRPSAGGERRRRCRPPPRRPAPSAVASAGAGRVELDAPRRGVAVARDRVRPRGVHTRSTSIRFSVRVPVLSEQMTVTDPSVSTAGSRRTSARRRAIAARRGPGRW